MHDRFWRGGGTARTHYLDDGWGLVVYGVINCGAAVASGNIAGSILSSAMVWLHTPQVAKKWHEQNHRPSLYPVW